VANEISNDVSQYAIGANGSLTAITAAIAAGSTPESVTVDPSGKYVYVANTGDNDVSRYAIGTDGSLTEITPVAAAGSSPASITTAR
jgi:YVTN family beta-propeller protein